METMRTVKILPDADLRSVAFRSEFSDWLRRLPLSRREMLDAGTEVLYVHLEAGGSIISGIGDEIRIYPGIFDDVHADDDGVWITEQRRNKFPQRRFPKRLIPRIRLYDAIGILSGRAITTERRRADIAEMRELLRRFNPVWRARYVNEIRKLRKVRHGKLALWYGTSVRQLRLRLKAELEYWESHQ